MLSELKNLGESLLRFGDMDLFSQIFTAVHQEYLNQSAIAVGPRRLPLVEGANKVEELKLNLIQNMKDFEVEEKNP